MRSIASLRKSSTKQQMRAFSRKVLVWLNFIVGLFHAILFPSTYQGKEVDRIGRLLCHTHVLSTCHPSSPSIFVSNHFSWVDYFVLHRFIPRCKAVVRSDIFKPSNRNKVHVPLIIRRVHELFLKYFDLLHAIPYDKYGTGQGLTGPETLESIKSSLESGFNVLIFPEGRTQRSTSAPREFSKGIFEYAERHGLRVHPVTIGYFPDAGIESGDSFSLSSFLEKGVQCFVHMETERVRDPNTARNVMLGRLKEFEFHETDPHVDREHDRMLMKMLLSACMLVIPVGVLWTCSDVSKWESALLFVQTSLYVFDMPFALRAKDRRQVLHHSIGLAFMVLRYFNEYEWLPRLVILILWCEQGGSTCVYARNWVRTCFQDSEKSKGEFVRHWAIAFMWIRLWVFYKVWITSWQNGVGTTMLSVAGVVFCSQLCWQWSGLIRVSDSKKSR